VNEPEPRLGEAVTAAPGALPAGTVGIKHVGVPGDSYVGLNNIDGTIVHR
jgi:hypothetical protein